MIAYGQVRGRFVSMQADGPDDDVLPDEVPLTGTVTLTASAASVRFPAMNPPRTAVVATLVCPVIDGELCAPNTTTPGVWLLATNQPNGEPNKIQWTAEFAFTGVTSRLASRTFDVPTDATIDLASVVPSAAEPGTVKVVSSEDRLTVEAAVASLTGVKGVQVSVLDSSAWPPPADPDPLHWYVRAVA